MLVEIDGQQYDVPDNATPQHIQKALGLKAPSASNSGQEALQNEEDPYSFLDTPRQNFGSRAIRDVGAGLINAIAGTVNSPHEFVKYAEEKTANRKPEAYEQQLRTLFGKPMEEQQGLKFSQYIPHIPEFDVNKLVGFEGSPGTIDKAIRGVTEFAIPFGSGKARGAAKAAAEFAPLTRKLGAAKLGRASDLVNKRNVGNLDIPEHLIEDLRQFLPKTTPYKKLLKEAKSGNYNKLFALQSDVGKEAGGRANNIFSFAERSHGRAGLKAREDLISKIKEELTNKGHEDIAELLGKGQGDYRRYIKIKPYRNALALGAVSQAIPQLNIIKRLMP